MRRRFFGKAKSLLFNMLSILVISCIPRSVFQFMTTVNICSDIEAKQIKTAIVSTISPSICHEVMRPDSMILVSLMPNFKTTFFTLLFHFQQDAVYFLTPSAIRVVSTSYLRLLLFFPSILFPACASSSLAFLMMYSAYK